MSAKTYHRGCQSYSVCKDLRKLLRKFGVEKDEIDPLCDAEAPWPCSHMLKNAQHLYDSVSPANAKEVLEFIEPMFATREQLVSDRFRDDYKEAPFQCPELGVDMFQPCTAGSCAFYTNNPWTRNCVLYYRVRHGRETLNLNELSFLLGREVSVLRSTLNRTFRQLSHGAFKETIERDHLSEMVTRINPENVCVVCERKLEGKRKVLRKGGFHYCGRRCVQKKPPQVIRLEQEFSLPIERLLSLCVEQFSSTKTMCAALGMGHAVFISWCDKFDIPIPSAKSSK
jgi:hypothetical protein